MALALACVGYFTVPSNFPSARLRFLSLSPCGGCQGILTRALFRREGLGAPGDGSGVSK